ncbi:Protein CBG14330 [Caenorhabditis briggsae]|uniref:Uncharacterized protein n=6 Tax=Caenorhabditis TaxID=6237 RepID=A0AAE9FEN9_CAEBR|nr:Protein CBG14330 [Caenorhabditis briggsae]PIC17943.1 hypothetical protein B9Z55_024004 [Caenorhabditis nigoni]ULT81961.1 hypothetical protein L3Y34_011729 [Caenorhabditis briggsae]UMM41268.1 hypothetical protein L5515_017605 [Caenorhabditis briggsae]CAP32900.2 Protein CBG14330 [Caenorhabditis briggsae]
MGPNMEIEKSKGVMQEILYEVIEKSESYKFIRMADDLHDVASYLNDMRICFIALTVTGYIVLVIYLFVFCFRRSRRNQPRRRYGDYQLENQREFNNTQTTNEDMLTNVRSDVNSSYMGRNHHRSHQNTAPTFMRHGHMNHQQTTRLVADNDGSAVKHQIPHITTEAPTEEKAKVPQLVKDSIDSN